jgi:beta-lactamase regulating signal transducer with metallopeptidase domain
MNNLDWLIDVTIAASVTAAIIFSIRLVFGRLLSAQLKYYLWFILILRLCVLTLPASTISVLQFIPTTSPVAMQSNFTQSGPAPISPADRQESPHGMLPAPSTNEASLPDLTDIPHPTSSSAPYDIGEIALLIYLTVASVMLIHNFVCYAVLKKQIAALPAWEDPDTLRAFEAAQKACGVRCNIILKKGASSMMVGLRKPFLVLPEVFKDDELQAVFTHELMHYKYGDLYINWLQAILRCVHWFNPLVWLSFRQMRRDCELCCDERVLALAGMDKKLYAQVLFKEAGTKRSFAVGTTTFANNAHDIKNRVQSIALWKKPGVLVTVCGLLILGVVAGITLTNANKPQTGVPNSALHSLRYENTDKGFYLEFPESWRGRYVVTEHGDTVLVRHKLTVEQMGENGDGAIGTLFRIHVYSPKSNWTGDGVPYSDTTNMHTIGESNNAWYALEYPTDVQVVDATYAGDYRELESDTGWIENGGFGVIGGNLLDLTKVGRFISGNELALSLDGTGIKHSNRFMYRYDGGDVYFKAKELGQILGVKVVEAFAGEAGDGPDIAPAGSVATFHNGLMSWQYKNDAYIYTGIANSDAGLEPALIWRGNPLIIDGEYYISSQALPYLFYTRIDLENVGPNKVKGNLTSFSAEAKRAQEVARTNGFTFVPDGRFRFDKYIMHGRYIVYQNHQAYVLDRDGYLLFGPVDGELHYASYGGYPITTRNELWGLYAYNGNLLLPPEYSSIQCVDFRKGLFLLTKGAGANRKFGAAVIAAGEIRMLLPDVYEAVMTFSDTDDSLPPEYQLYFDQYLSVKKDGKWGAYDLKGNLTVPLVYDAFGQFLTTGNIRYHNLFFDREKEYITVKQNGKWGVINMQNEIMVPFAYDAIFTKDLNTPTVWYGKKGTTETRLN